MEEWLEKWTLSFLFVLRLTFTLWIVIVNYKCKIKKMSKHKSDVEFCCPSLSHLPSYFLVLCFLWEYVFRHHDAYISVVMTFSTFRKSDIVRDSINQLCLRAPASRRQLHSSCDEEPHLRHWCSVLKQPTVWLWWTWDSLNDVKILWTCLFRRLASLTWFNVMRRPEYFHY